MEDSQFIFGVIGLLGLLTLATIVHAFAKWMKMPFVVGLLGMGILLSVIMKDLPQFWQIHFSPEIIFYVFLPTLIFESAYHLKFRHFQGVFREVVALATFGLFISIAIIGFGLHLALGMDLLPAFLFASLISATDPVAVLAIFKELKAPKRLSTIIDGESLVNDGTALVIFQFFLKLALAGAGISWSLNTLGHEGLNLLQSLSMGLLVGCVLGVAFSYAIANTHNRSVQLTLSLILAHTTFLVAEGLLHVSGILATMAAGLIVGNFGRRKLTESAKKSFSEIWDFLGFISNALVFILLGLKLGEVDFQTNAWAIFVSIVLAIFLARPISVWSTLSLTNLTRDKTHKTSTAYKSVTAWGGIRGALAAAAVLLIPEELPYASTLQAMTAGVILTTVLINGTTIGHLLRVLGLIRFTDSEKFQRSEARLIINEEISQYLEKLKSKKYIAPKIYKKLKADYEFEHKDFIQELKKWEVSLKDNVRETEKILTHFALGIEMRTYKKLFQFGEITEDRFLVLIQSINRQNARLDDDILPDERGISYQYAPKIPAFSKRVKCLNALGLCKLAVTMQNHWKCQKVLARLQHYRARRIASWKVVRDFQNLQDEHPIFKDSVVVEKIINRYQEWNANAEIKMGSLEKEFPSIVEGYQMMVAKRLCFNREQRIEGIFFEKGLINEKIYDDLTENVGKKVKSCKNQNRFFSIF